MQLHPLEPAGMSNLSTVLRFVIFFHVFLLWGPCAKIWGERMERAKSVLEYASPRTRTFGKKTKLQA